MEEFAKALGKNPVIGAGVVLFGAWLVFGHVWRRKLEAAGDAIGDAAGAVGTAVNPADPDNLAYRGTNAIGAAVTGDQSFSLGAWLYERVHGDDDPNAAPSDTESSLWRRLTGG